MMLPSDPDSYWADAELPADYLCIWCETPCQGSAHTPYCSAACELASLRHADLLDLCPFCGQHSSGYEGPQWASYCGPACAIAAETESEE